MDEEACNKLFVEAVEDLCKMEGPDANVRLPFNVSKINDRMQKLSEKKFHITNTPYKRFAGLVKKMEEDEHLTTKMMKDSLVIEATKYASDLMKIPLTDEEKAAIVKAREEKRALKDAEKKAAAAEADTETKTENPEATGTEEKAEGDDEKEEPSAANDDGNRRGSDDEMEDGDDAAATKEE